MQAGVVKNEKSGRGTSKADQPGSTGRSRIWSEETENSRQQTNHHAIRRGSHSKQTAPSRVLYLLKKKEKKIQDT